jgi:RNA polymerase sigma-70 factor (ECF subfamily)
LSMHDIEDYSLPELSEIMGVPIGTLKSRLHRARAKLRELLATERFESLDRV